MLDRQRHHLLGALKRLNDGLDGPISIFSHPPIATPLIRSSMPARRSVRLVLLFRADDPARLARAREGTSTK
jgi:hypothetical protein